MSTATITQKQSDSPQLITWILSSSAPQIHRLAYCGVEQILKEQIALLHGADLYRDFVNKVTSQSIIDPVLPLVIKGDERLAATFSSGVEHRTYRLSQVVPLSWEALNTQAGPYHVTPMQLAAMRGHQHIIQLLMGANRLRRHPIPSSAENAAASTWAKEIFVQGGTATHISQFTSSLDVFLQRELGDDLFQTNIAKVILNDRRYIFIADRHQIQAFRRLIQPIITEIERTRETKPVAYFMEGTLRNPVMEAPVYQGYHDGIQPQGLFYGLEPEFFFIINWLQKYLQLTTAQNQDPGALEILWDATYNPATRQALSELQRRQYGPQLTVMIRSFSTCTQIARENIATAYEALVAQPFFKDHRLWANFYLEMARVGMDLGWMPPVGIQAMRDVIAHPNDEDAIERFQRVNFEVRDPIIAQNVLSVVRSLPQEVEVAIFIGYLHMPGLVYYLQRNSP